MNKILTTVARRPIYWDGTTLSFVAGMTIDADGSGRVYGPNNSGLDYTANAGANGVWWGLVADAQGNPIIQGPNDPYPGMYVSTTSYQRSQFKKNDPRRYVDSEKVPFIVLPGFVRELVGPIVLGCAAEASFGGVTKPAVIADFGPSKHLGEASIALASQLSISSNARTGGTSSEVIYRVYPGRTIGIDGETFELQPA